MIQRLIDYLKFRWITRSVPQLPPHRPNSKRYYGRVRVDTFDGDSGKHTARSRFETVGFFDWEEPFFPREARDGVSMKFKQTSDEHARIWSGEGEGYEAVGRCSRFEILGRNFMSVEITYTFSEDGKILRRGTESHLYQEI